MQVSQEGLYVRLREFLMSVSRHRICGRVSAGAVLLVFALLISGAVALRAQSTTGRIVGTVTDASGAVVPKASITITNTGTGVVLQTVTTSDGLFNEPSVLAGTYTVEAQAPGYAPAEVTGVQVAVGTDSSVNLKLAVGSVTQAVTVTTEAQQVDTTSATIGDTITSESIADLPLNGRNWSDLTLLQAGVSQLRNLSLIGGSAGNVYSVNGADIRSNMYLLDGAIMNNLFDANNASIIGSSLGVDGIQEYKVVTSGYSAQYGLLNGSQAILVSKGGTNEWHGDAYDYLRNSSMDADSYFDTRVTGTDLSSSYPSKRLPPFRRNNFGGAVGGPIKKDKTFFFAVFEGLQEQVGTTAEDNTLGTGCFTSTSTAQSYTVLGTTANPFTTAAQWEACTKTTSVPASVTFPYAAPADIGEALPFYPYPNITNSSAYNYAYVYITPEKEQYGQLRIDQNFSAKDTSFLRYTIDDSGETTAAGFLAPSKAPQILEPQHSSSIYATAAENHVISSALVNTARLSFSRTQEEINTAYPAGVTSSPLPNEDLNSPYGTVSPGGGLTGVGGGGADPAPGNVQNVITPTDDVFWTKGKHTIQFGVMYNRFQDSINTLFALGAVKFGNVAAFLENDYSQVQFNTANTDQHKSFLYGTLGQYIQDDWKVTPRLTLNLGVRYEVYLHMPRTLSGEQTWSTPNPATATAPNFAIQTPAVSTNPSLHNFSPRVGFALDVFGNGKTSLRGSGGIFYEVGLMGGILTNTTWAQPPTEVELTIPNANPTPCLPAVFPLDNMETETATTTAPCPSVTPATSTLYSPRSLQYNAAQPSLGIWSASIQQQLPWKMVLTVTYDGSKGWHLPRVGEGNGTIPAGFSGGLPYYCNPVDGSPGPPSAGHPCANTFTPVRPNTLLGAFYVEQEAGSSWYDAGEVTLEKRLSNGLQIQNNITWEHDIDDGVNQIGSDNTQHASVFPEYNRIDRANSNFSIPINERVNVIYHIPGPNSNMMLANFAKGWWTSGIFSAESGNYFNIYVGVNRSLAASAKNLEDRMSFDPTFNKKTFVTGNINQWFNPSMLDVPPAGTLGNMPANMIRGPQYADFDYALTKDTHIAKLGEAGNLEFRAEFFNVLNHPSFNVPDTGAPSGGPTDAVTTLSAGATLPCGGQAGTAVTCPNGTGSGTLTISAKAGQVSQTVSTARQIQLSLKILF